MCTITTQNKQITLLLSETIITRIMMFMCVPFLMIFLSNDFHFSATELSLIVGINPLCTVLFGPLGGRVTDRISRSKTLYLVPFFWGLVYISFAFASHFLTFLVLNGLNGICYVTYESTVKKVLSFNSTLENRKLVFNLRYTCLAIGAFVGPLLQLLVSNYSTAHMYCFLGITYLASAFLNKYFFKELPQAEETTQAKVGSHAPTTDKKSILLFLCFLSGIAFSYFAYAQFQSTVSLFFTSEIFGSDGYKKYSLMLSLNALLILLLQFPVLRMTRRFSPLKLLMVSNSLFSLSLLLIPQSHSWSILGLMVGSLSLGEVLLGSNFDYTVDTFSTAENKGFYFGLSEMVRIGNTVGPIIGGLLIEYYTFEQFKGIFLILSILTLSGQPLLWFYGRKNKQVKTDLQSYH